jgi:hypothetical protein
VAINKRTVSGFPNNVRSKIDKDEEEALKKLAAQRFLGLKILAGQGASLDGLCSKFVTPHFKSAPRFAPNLVLRWPQAVARDISFVRAHDFRFHHLDETRLVLLRYVLGGMALDESGGRLLVHPVTHDLRNDRGDQCAVAQGERVGFTERLTHGRIACARTLVSPHKHVAQ